MNQSWEESNWRKAIAKGAWTIQKLLLRFQRDSEPRGDPKVRRLKWFGHRIPISMRLKVRANRKFPRTRRQSRSRLFMSTRWSHARRNCSQNRSKGSARLLYRLAIERRWRRSNSTCCQRWVRSELIQLKEYLERNYALTQSSWQLSGIHGKMARNLNHLSSRTLLSERIAQSFSSTSMRAESTWRLSQSHKHLHPPRVRLQTLLRPISQLSQLPYAQLVKSHRQQQSHLSHSHSHNHNHLAPAAWQRHSNSPSSHRPRATKKPHMI